mmetsp:Transcript_148158/g.359654  ORF Transcript_148158/g.359654 Transcript_148158/m.359654 type:complete len:623 (+) Transcript_148158:794-2662(+)
MVALHRDPTLFAITVGPDLLARHAPLGVVHGVVQRLQGLANLQLSDRLAARADVEGRGDRNALHADQGLLGLQQLLARGVPVRDPAGGAVPPGRAAEPDHLPGVLLAGALEDLQDLAGLHLPDLRAGVREGLLDFHIRLAAVVGLGALVQEARAMVALQGDKAFLSIQEGPAPRAREPGGCLHLGGLQDLDELRNSQLAQGLALLDLKGRGDGNVLDAPHVLLQDAQQRELRDPRPVTLQCQVQLRRLQPRLRHGLQEGPESRLRDVGRALAQLLEERVRLQARLPDVGAEGGHHGLVRVRLHLPPRRPHRQHLLLAARLAVAQLHLQLDQHAASLGEGPPDVHLDLVQVHLQLGVALVHSLQRSLELPLRRLHRRHGALQVGPPGLHQGLGRRHAHVHPLLQRGHRCSVVVHHGLGGAPVDRLLAPLLFGLHACGVPLLRLQDLLLQCRLQVLHLHDPRPQLHELGLGLDQRPRLHAPQLVCLLVHVLRRLEDGLRHVLQGALDPLLRGVVGGVRLQVHRALIPRDGHEALLAVLLGLRVHPHEPQALIARGLPQRLDELVDVHLAEGLGALDTHTVRHGDRGGNHVLLPEVLRELLQSQVSAGLAARALEGGLQLVLLEE